MEILHINSNSCQAGTLEPKYVNNGFSLVTTSCLTLCNPMNYSPPSSPVHGVLQQEYWTGLPFPSPGDLPGSGVEPISPALAGGFFTPEPPGIHFIKIKLQSSESRNRASSDMGDIHGPRFRDDSGIQHGGWCEHV